MIAEADALLSFLPPLLRIGIWASLSAAFGMAIYARLSPQQRLIALKQEQKAARAALMHHDGDFSALWVLIRRDLGISLRQIRLMLLPFLLSLAPFILLMVPLSEIYVTMPGFEWWYIGFTAAVSLALKYTFKIA